MLIILHCFLFINGFSAATYCKITTWPTVEGHIHIISDWSQNPALCTANFPATCVSARRTKALEFWAELEKAADGTRFGSAVSPASSDAQVSLTPTDICSSSWCQWQLWWTVRTARGTELSSLRPPSIALRQHVANNSAKCFWFFKRLGRDCFSHSPLISVTWIKLATQKLNEIPYKTTDATVVI